MKKLMIAAAIVCASALVQAASVNWNSGEIYFAGDGKANDGSAGGSLVADGTVTMYVFSHIDADDYATFALLSNLDAYNQFTAAGADSTLKIGENTYALSDGYTFGTSADGMVEVGDESGYVRNEMAYGVAILTYDQDLDGKVDYVAIGEATGKVPTAGLDLGGIGVMRDDGSSATWSAVGGEVVPEPTSGLLLLIGVAGLALKRRHA